MSRLRETLRRRRKERLRPADPGTVEGTGNACFVAVEDLAGGAGQKVIDAICTDAICTEVMPPSPEPLDTWFKREVLTHDGILVRFIARVWPRRDEIADIQQEAYVRVYEAARQVRPDTPKAFLFATARHLMADRVRRERIVSIRAGGDNEFLNVLVEEISPEQRVSAHQELARLARAFDRLSPKCREVVWLRRVKELSQKEVAERLGLAEKTIEKHLRTGARLLARYMRETALVPRTKEIDEQETDEARREHGPHP